MVNIFIVSKEYVIDRTMKYNDNTLRFVSFNMLCHII